MTRFATMVGLTAMIVLLALRTDPSFGDILVVTFELPDSGGQGVSAPTADPVTFCRPPLKAAGSATTGLTGRTGLAGREGSSANHGAGKPHAGRQPLKSPSLPAAKTGRRTNPGGDGGRPHPNAMPQADQASVELLGWIEGDTPINLEPSLPDVVLGEVGTTSEGGTVVGSVSSHSLLDDLGDLGGFEPFPPPVIWEVFDVGPLPVFPVADASHERVPDDIRGKQSVPEPAAAIVWLVLASLGIAIGWQRRRKAGCSAFVV